MKGVEIQIKAIMPSSSWLAKPLHPATVHRHNPVFMLISQAGVSDFIFGSFAEYEHLLHSRVMYIQAQDLKEKKAFTGRY